MHRILPFMDSDTWSRRTWHGHRLPMVSAQSERDDIMGYFVD
jgi:hypothetical protein